MAPSLGDTLTIDAKVLHVVDLGGGETNYCLELPSGHTTWVLGSQLGVDQEEEAEKSVPGPPDTKSVPGPDQVKGPAKKAAARKRAPAAA